MCHNVAGAGGALTEGKYAPTLMKSSAPHIYEAMVTGPQNMPVFNDDNITPQDKHDIITALHSSRTPPRSAASSSAASARSRRASSSGSSASARSSPSPSG